MNGKKKFWGFFGWLTEALSGVGGCKARAGGVVGIEKYIEITFPLREFLRLQNFGWSENFRIFIRININNGSGNEWKKSSIGER